MLRLRPRPAIRLVAPARHTSKGMIFKMKKHYILLAAACALIACDPIEEDGTFDTIPVSSEALAEGFNLVQTDKNGNPAADGNYFKFTTNPARIVKVYNFKADGS